MDIIEWIKINYPGRINQINDRIEIIHNTGEYSTLWLNTLKLKKDIIGKLNEIYSKYDGMDLFSSTFKVAALETPKRINDVIIVQSLRQVAKDLNPLQPKFPEESIPFMYQAGIGFYAVGIASRKIYEWDEEENNLSGEYKSIVEILDEWVKAIRKQR